MTRLLSLLARRISPPLSSFGLCALLTAGCSNSDLAPYSTTPSAGGAGAAGGAGGSSGGAGGQAAAGGSSGAAAGNAGSGHGGSAPAGGAGQAGSGGASAGSGAAGGAGQAGSGASAGSGGASGASAGSGGAAGAGPAGSGGAGQAGSGGQTGSSTLVVTTALMLSETTVKPGGTLTGTITYTNQGTLPILVQAAGISSRPPGGTHSGGPFDDFSPAVTNVTVPAGMTFMMTGSRVFSASDPAGQWEAYSTWQDAGGTYHDDVSLFFTVNPPAKTTRESMVWLWRDYPNSLAAILANPSSFTTVMPALYQSPPVGYQGGAVPYVDLGGLSISSLVSQLHGASMKVVPMIYGGQSGADMSVNGADKDLIRIWTDASVGDSFISFLVNEAVTNHYDGYNLDWEVNPTLTGAQYWPAYLAFLTKFKAQLAPHNMSLSIDVIDSYVNQNGCNGSGLVDLPQAQASTLDYVMIEAYDTHLGGPSMTCINYKGLPPCFAGTLTDDLNLMCSYMGYDKLVMGLGAYKQASNDIAGAAFTTFENYGVKNVAFWPGWEDETKPYVFMAATNITPPGATWYDLAKSFVQAP